MNAVIYCRVSSKEQVEGTSLASQEMACRDYATRNHLNVVKVFVERGESAKYADRTQLLELLTFCSKRVHGVTHLLVWKVDRLARNVGDHFNIKASLLKQDVTVVSVTEPIDTKPEGKLLETILAGFAQFDNDIRAARTVQGMRRKIQEGISPWKAPLGYKSGNSRGSKKMEPDQPDQPSFSLLQQAWKEFATGRHTKAEILRLMTSRGLRTRVGKPLSKQSLDYVFTDVFYVGIVRDPWTGEEHAGRHLPMITRETFAKVKQITAQTNHSVPHKAVRTEFPLRTFALCPCCERTLTGAFSRGRSSIYPYYRCFYRNCDSQTSYPIAEVHREFIRFLNQMSVGRHALDHLKQVILLTSDAWRESTRAIDEKRAVEMKRIEQQKDQLIRMKMDQLISDEEFLAQRLSLTTRVSELEVGPIHRDAKPEDVISEIDALCEHLMALGATWERISSDLKRRFQHIAFPEGYVLGAIGTAQKGRLFSFFESSHTPKTSLVPLTGQSWNQLAEEISAFASIMRESSIDMR